MHSSEGLGSTGTASGPGLLLQLGRLIMRGRQRQEHPLDTTTSQNTETQHDRLLQAKLRAARALTPHQPVASTSKASPPRTLFEPAAVEEAIARAKGSLKLDQQEDIDKTKRRIKIEAQLSKHVAALWNDQIPICIEVLLGPDCAECKKQDQTAQCDTMLLLERWTLAVFLKKNHETQVFITSQWLLNAVRSQLHFSQLSAWLAMLTSTLSNQEEPLDPHERQRKLSRETCNIKKLEANCDDEEITKDSVPRNLNVVYSIKIPGESYKITEFNHPPNDHVFPITDIGNNVYLKVSLESLPRIDEIPTMKCSCRPPKRRISKDMTPNLHDDLALRMNDLTLGPSEGCIDSERCKGAKFSPDLGIINSNIGSSGISRKLSIFSNPMPPEYVPNYESEIQSKRGCDKRSLQLDRPFFGCGKDTVVRANYVLVDDRMHTPCSESGKHRCSCDDESDGNGNAKSSTRINKQERKHLDDRRLKEIAKYKRRLRKESKLKKMQENGTSESAGASECGESSSERTETKSEHPTSIPILQASRFDRMRTIGCFRNQAYLTIPASRSEKTHLSSETLSAVPTSEYRKTVSVSTQTDAVICACGSPLEYQCVSCDQDKGMVRSEASYDLTSLDRSELLLDAMRRTCQLHSPVHEKVDKKSGSTSDKSKRKENKSASSSDDSRNSGSQHGRSSSSKDDIGKDGSKNDREGFNSKNYEKSLHKNQTGSVVNAKRSHKVDKVEVEKVDNTRKKVHDDSLDEENVMKKHKCDNNDSFNNIKCDTSSFSLDKHSCYSDRIDKAKNPGIRKYPDDDDSLSDRANIIKRPKLKRFYPVVNKIEQIVSERSKVKDDSEQTNTDIDELLLKDDDSVFAYMGKTHTATQRRKMSSTSEDEYILYEKSDYNVDTPTCSFNPFLNPDGSFKFPDEISPRDGIFKFPIAEVFNTPKGIPLNLNTNLEASNSTQVRDAITTGVAAAREGSGLSRVETVPSPGEMDRFRWRFDSAASMVFHTRTGLPLTSSPAPLRKGKLSFDYDSSIIGIKGIKSALFNPISPSSGEGWRSPGSSPGSPRPVPAALLPPPPQPITSAKLRNTNSCLLGNFEESVLKGRLEPVATVAGFQAELGASGAFCPPHRRLPVTVFFYAPGGTNAPYLGHINLGSSGYRVPTSGTVQVSLFNPHGTLVKMFVVLYDLTDMPPNCRTFLRQRTVYVPTDAPSTPPQPATPAAYKHTRYLIHLRFLTSKSGKLYLHTDIRIIVSKKSDLDTATILKSLSTNQNSSTSSTTNQNTPNVATNGNDCNIVSTNKKEANSNNETCLKETTNMADNLNGNWNSNNDSKESKQTANESAGKKQNGRPNRVFGGCAEFDIEDNGFPEKLEKYDVFSAKSDRDFLEKSRLNRSEACMELSNHCQENLDVKAISNKVDFEENVSYELRSFTYAPDNPRYSPR